MFSKVVIVGRLGNDVSMRYTPQGAPVSTMSVASSDKFSTPSGEKKEVTTWFRVTTWNKLAEHVNQYLKKGSLVLVEGTLIPDESGSPRIWMNKENKPCASFEVRAETVKFLDKVEKKEETPQEIPA